MSSSYDLRHERDSTLVSDFVTRARELRRACEEWIQAEVTDCLPKAQIIQASEAGILKDKAQALVQRLEHINLLELPEAVNNLNDRCAEITTGAWDENNILDAHHYLEDALSRFQGLIRELSQIRKSLDTLQEE